MKKLWTSLWIIVLSLLLTSCWWNEDIKEPVLEKNQEEVIKGDEFNKKLSNELKDEVSEIGEKVKNWEITEEDAEKMTMKAIDSSSVVKTELEKQKEQMPKFLKIIELNRDCMSKAEEKSDAEKCMEEVEKSLKEFWDEEFELEDEELEDFEWNEEEKRIILAEMDEWIAQMQKMIPCVEKAEVMSDLMKCWEWM